MTYFIAVIKKQTYSFFKPRLTYGVVILILKSLLWPVVGVLGLYLVSNSVLYATAAITAACFFLLQQKSSRDEVEMLRTELQDVKATLSRLSATAKIGFTALFNAGYQTYDPETTIPFPAIVYNSGEYNPDSSTFTCPAHAVYAFTVTLSTEIRLDADLMMNNVPVINVNVDEEDHGSQMMGTGFVITECNAGEEVKVVVRTRSTINYGDDSSTVRNTFSGYLLALL